MRCAPIVLVCEITHTGVCVSFINCTWNCQQYLLWCRSLHCLWSCFRSPRYYQQQYTFPLLYLWQSLRYWLKLYLYVAYNVANNADNIVRGISLYCFIMVYSIFIPWPMAFLLQNFGNEFIFDVLASSNRFTLPEDSALTLQYIFFGSKQQTRLLQIFSRNLS